MEKLANTKLAINYLFESLKDSYLKEDVTERELEYIKTMINKISEATVYDVKNSMNEVINEIYK